MTAAVLSFLGTSGLDASWNDPYSGAKSAANTFYSTFSERPKHLDPARSYSSDEYVFIAQIYEPPLQYHYLKRPYTLIPLSSDRMPKITGKSFSARVKDEILTYLEEYRKSKD